MAETSEISPLPSHIDILSPLLARYSSSALLSHEAHPSTNNSITTVPSETYGPPTAPLGFRVGNGGAGYSGLIRTLCTAFLDQRNGDPFRIEWVSNHSRHTHAALLGDIVQVALTYEPDWEDLTIREGWARRVCRAFNDGFVLVGPASNPARIPPDCDVLAAFKQIARAGYEDRTRVLFHTRGDGSATHYKELKLWALSGVDLADSSWREKHPGTPSEALTRANAAIVYVLTDRATFLTAAKEGLVSGMKAYAEGSPLLVNPCSALINVKAPENRLALDFASWLQSETAQDIVQKYGTDWPLGLPLFARADIDIMMDSAHLKSINIIDHVGR